MLSPWSQERSETCPINRSLSWREGEIRASVRIWGLPRRGGQEPRLPSHKPKEQKQFCRWRVSSEFVLFHIGEQGPPLRRKQWSVLVIYVPRICLCSSERCVWKAARLGEVPISDLHRKLEIGNQGLPPLYLWLTLKQTQHPPWPLLPPSVAGCTCQKPTLLPKSNIWPASWVRESFSSQECSAASPWLFLSSTKHTLTFFPLLFKCSSIMFIKQRDVTFGKIILSSTPTCDHNFKSRNLLSSCGKNKGPETDIRSGGRESAFSNMLG